MTWRDFGALRNILISLYSPISEILLQIHYSWSAGRYPGILSSSMRLAEMWISSVTGCDVPFQGRTGFGGSYADNSLSSLVL
jgi:hypothetical protein